MKNNIKKIREQQSVKNIEKIRKKLENMDSNFWKSLALESAIVSEKYQKEQTEENLKAIENWFRKVFTLQIQCDGYHEIVDFPDNYDDIVQRIHRKLENVENEVCDSIKNIKERFSANPPNLS